MVGYLPIKLRLNPVKKIINIPFESNSDELYNTLEFQYLESFERGKGYRVLAYKANGEVDVYEDETLIKEKNEDFSSFFNRKGKIYSTEFEKPKFEIDNDILVIYFEFRDLMKRKIVVDIKEPLKKIENIDMLDKNGFNIDLPTFLPLVLLYDMNYINRKSKYNISINDKKIKIAKEIEEYPKTSNHNSGAKYSLDVQIIEFGYDDGIEMIDLTHEITTDSFNYVFKDDRLTEISLVDEKKPFKVIFQPGFPQKVGVGKFVINTSHNMGKIVGTYNSVMNGQKIKTNFTLGKWNPIPTIKGMKNVMNEKSTFRMWTCFYELSRMVDLNILESTSKWVNNKQVLHDEEIY